MSKTKNKSNIKNKDKLEVSKQRIPRSKEKYPALNFKRQVKLRKDYLEGIEEYVDQLSDKEKEWLNSFLEETVITNFQHKGRKFYKSKKAKREFYNSNNARNRCMFTKAKAMNSLFSTESLPSLDLLFSNEQGNSYNNDTEDAMIAAIELKNSGIIEQELQEADEHLTAMAEIIRHQLELDNAKMRKRDKKASKTSKRNS